MATAVNTSTQQYFGFDPRTIPGCVLWHDAADSSTFTFSSGSVTAWRNKASTTSAVATANTPITLNANGLGTGYPALIFPATITHLSGSVSFGITASLSVFSVFSMSASSGVAARVLSLAATNVPDYNNLSYVGILRQTVANMGPYRNVPYAGAAISYDTRVMNTSVVEGVSVEEGEPTSISMLSATDGGTPVRINTTPAFFGISAYRIANTTENADTGPGRLQGSIGEIIAFGSSLTLNERQQVEGYLAWKWGLESKLPVGHPFKYNPTAMRVFRPIDIFPCALWLDAADSSTIVPANITSGTAITRWNDKSSNATFAVPERGPSGIAPVFSNVGGVQSIFINNGGVNTNYNASTYTQLTLQSNIQTSLDYTVFGVINFNTVASGSLQTIYSNHRATGAESRAPHFGAGSTFEAPAPFRIIDISFIGTGILQTCLISSSSLFSQNRNGSGYGSVSGALANRSSTDGGPFPTIGGTFTTTNGVDSRFTTGHFHELILYNKALTFSERQRVEGYLTEKWRTPALPVSHPFYLQRSLPSTSLFSPTTLKLTPNLLCRFFNLTATPPSTTLGGSGWGNEIGTRGYYNPINFQDGDARIGQSDNVGIACTGFVFSATSGTIRLRVVTDDGSIVRFNGVDVITAWYDQGPTEYISASLPLNPGYNPIEYLFYERVGGMTCQLSYELNNSAPFLSDGTGVFFGSVFGSTSTSASNHVALWLDAADPSTLTTSGTTVTQWRDKSGNGRHMNVGSGTTTYISNSVRLNNSYMFVTSPVNLQSFSFFIVCEAPIPVGGNQVVFSARPTSGFDYSSVDAFGFYVDEGGVRMYGRLSATESITNALTPSTRFLTSFLGVSSGELSSFQNGKRGGSAITTTRGGTAQGFAIGASWANGFYNTIQSTAYIYEIVVFNQPLTSFFRQQVEGYLAWKWGLQNSLPNFSGFVPSLITGLVLWNDASIFSGTPDGTTIGTWANTGNLGGTVNCSGTVSSVRLNGLRVVRLTTTQTWSTSVTINLPAYSLFFVTRQIGGTNRRVLQGTTNNQLYGHWGGNKRVLFIDGNPNFLGGAPAVTGDQVWDVYSHTRTAGGPYRFNANATLLYSGGTSAATNMTGLAINTGAYPAETSDCEVAEIILYSSVLSTDDVLRVEGYLAWKWGLSVSPAFVHPFSKFRP